MSLAAHYQGYGYGPTSPVWSGRKSGLSRPREWSADIPLVPYAPLPTTVPLGIPFTVHPYTTPFSYTLHVPVARSGAQVLQQCLATDDDTCSTETCIDRCLQGVRQAHTASWEYLTGDPGFDRGVCLARHAHLTPHASNRLCSTLRLHGYASPFTNHLSY